MKLISTNRSLFILFIFLFFPFGVSAQMVLNDSIVHFGKGFPDRSDIEVFNSGEAPLYLQVTPYQIMNPGSDDQQKVKVGNPKEAGLLVSPKKMVVPPGGRKLVRFVNMNKDRSQEKIFRVLFEPVTGEVKAEQTGLKLLIGYEVLVLMQPENPVSDLVAERKGNELHLKNEGNTNVYLRDVKQCPPGSSSDEACKSIQDKRLYPGNTWQVSLSNDWPVHFEMAVAEKRTKRVVQ